MKYFYILLFCFLPVLAFCDGDIVHIDGLIAVIIYILIYAFIYFPFSRKLIFKTTSIKQKKVNYNLLLIGSIINLTVLFSMIPDSQTIFWDWDGFLDDPLWFFLLGYLPLIIFIFSGYKLYQLMTEKDEELKGDNN